MVGRHPGREEKEEDPPPLAFPSLFSRLVNHPLSLSAPFASSPSPFLPAFAQPLPPPSPSPHVNRVFLLLLQQQRKAQGRWGGGKPEKRRRSEKLGREASQMLQARGGGGGSQGEGGRAGEPRRGRRNRGSRGSWEGGGAAARYPKKRRGEGGKENYFCSKEGGTSLK